LTLVPQPRLLIALLLGAILVLLILAHPVFLVVFLGYYAVLLGLALADASRLPKTSGFMASRVLALVEHPADDQAERPGERGLSETG